jgi:hypothetical protein
LEDPFEALQVLHRELREGDISSLTTIDTMRIKLAIHDPVCRRGRPAQFNLHSFNRFPATTYTPRFAVYAGLRSHTLSGQ